MEKLRKFPKIPERIPQRLLYAFGAFRVDPVKRLLLRNGEPISLSPKDFELLMTLVQRHGEVLVKEELMETLWSDTAVEEGNLNRHISTLRKRLGESPNEHEYIVTVPGRGYRFVAQVTEEWIDTAERLAPVPQPPGPPVKDGDLLDSSAFDSHSSVAPTAVVQHPGIVRPPLLLRLYSHWLALIALATIALLTLTVALPLVRRSKPILTTSDYVLISDFANATGDPVFDDTMKQAISVDLAESPFLSIFSDATIRATLKLMTKPPDTRLTPEVARELCQRAGGKAYIAGTLASLGSQFVIGLNAVDCATGDTLARQQVTARSKEYVLKALDEAAAKIRNTLGESRSTLERYDTSLEQATTPSLEALKAFTQGNLARDKKGDAATIPFFNYAIQLDPQFALAYDALGLTYSNLDEPGLASEYISKAYGLRERAGELEKYQIAANYSQIVTGDLENAGQISELWAQAYPRVPYPHNLLGINFEFLGQYEKAAQEISEALRLNPDGVVLHSDLMEDLTALNRLDEAKAIYRQALQRGLDHTYLHGDRYAIAFLEQDRPEMDRAVAWAAGRPGAEDLLLSVQSDTYAFSGNVDKARDYSRRAFVSAQRAGQLETAALWRMNSALREVEFGNVARARLETNAALKTATSRDVQILAALVLARAGDVQKSQIIADGLAARFPRNTVIQRYWLPSILAAIELNRRKPTRALEILQSVSAYDFAYPNPQAEIGRLLYPVYLRGQAYLLLGEGAPAIEQFQKFNDHPSLVVNCPLGPMARLGIARAYSLQGNVGKARSVYREFLDLWKDASGEIPALNQAKREHASLSQR